MHMVMQAHQSFKSLDITLMFLVTFELLPEVTSLPTSFTEGLPLFNKVYIHLLNLLYNCTFTGTSLHIK